MKKNRVVLEIPPSRVWLADQTALRSQNKPGKVVSVNTDKNGIVRDGNVKTFPSNPVPLKKPITGKESHPHPCHFCDLLGLNNQELAWEVLSYIFIRKIKLFCM